MILNLNNYNFGMFKNKLQYLWFIGFKKIFVDFFFIYLILFVVLINYGDYNLNKFGIKLWY